MSPSRRTTGVNPQSRGSRRKTRALDVDPDLAPDDLRRTGSMGLILLTMGSVLFGMGVGFLIFPKLLHGKREPAAQEEKDGAARERRESTMPPKGPPRVVLDPDKLYPHRNQLPAGLAPKKAPPAGPPEKKEPDTKAPASE